MNLPYSCEGTKPKENEMSEANKEQFIQSVMENFPESAECLRCTKWNYKKLEFNFFDEEEEKKYSVNKEKLLAAIPLIFTDKWGKGLTKVPANLLQDTEVLEDWLCEADAWDFDAFIQLAIFGEVIYG